MMARVDTADLRRRIAKLQNDVAGLRGTPIHTNLAALCSMFGWTRQQLSERTGITPDRLARIEDGTTLCGPSWNERKALEKATHESADWLLGEYNRDELDERILRNF